MRQAGSPLDDDLDIAADVELCRRRRIVAFLERRRRVEDAHPRDERIEHAARQAAERFDWPFRVVPPNPEDDEEAALKFGAAIDKHGRCFLRARSALEAKSSRVAIPRRQSHPRRSPAPIRPRARARRTRRASTARAGPDDDPDPPPPRDNIPGLTADSRTAPHTLPPGVAA